MLLLLIDETVDIIVNCWYYRQHGDDNETYIGVDVDDELAPELLRRWDDPGDGAHRFQDERHIAIQRIAVAVAVAHQIQVDAIVPSFPAVVHIDDVDVAPAIHQSINH